MNRASRTDADKFFGAQEGFGTDAASGARDAYEADKKPEVIILGTAIDAKKEG